MLWDIQSIIITKLMFNMCFSRIIDLNREKKTTEE